MKLILLVTASLMLTGFTCSKSGQAVSVQTANPADNFDVVLLFQKDGCKVYRFSDYRYHYFTNCSETISTYKSGKTTLTERIGGNNVRK